MSNSPDIQAMRILEALTALYPDGAPDAAQLVENALCDLRHLADKNWLIYSRHDRAAHRLYLEEKAA
jgi:hypothetical protein